MNSNPMFIKTQILKTKIIVHVNNRTKNYVILLWDYILIIMHFPSLCFKQ